MQKNKKGFTHKKCFVFIKDLIIPEKKINLYWFREPNVINFGDELSPYIISKLFKVRINDFQKNSLLDYIMLNTYRSLNILIKLRNKLFKNKINLKRLRSKVYIAVGSIICKAKPNYIVWGSGLINKDDIIEGGKFYAVRGYRTIDRLIELGLKAPSIVGDPALLLPLVYKPKIEKQYELGIIPNYIDNELIYKNISDKEILVIDLANGDIEFTIDQILKCNKIISSSLHGIIVSHAYGIPALWYKFSNNLWGDDIKFKDYFSSVNIIDYEPFNIDFSQYSIDEIISNIEKNKTINRINSNLEVLQKKLIKAAPFYLKRPISYLQ